MIVLHALNISKVPLDKLNTSFIMVFTHTFIITRGSIKLFEATSILLSKSATTLFEILSFYCFVGNPMPKFQLFPMVKPLVLCQKMFCLLIEWGFPLLKNIFPWIYISSLNIYLIFYNLGPWPICECAKKQPMVFSALACLKIPKKSWQWEECII